MMLPPRYPQIVELSRTSYIEQLTELLQRPAAQVSVGLRRTATEALNLMRLAGNVQAPPPAAIAPTHASLRQAQLGPDDVAALINQYGLGFGRDDAKVIFLGSEQAFSITAYALLALEAIAFTALWCWGFPIDLVVAITGFANWAAVNAGAPFHHRPLPYYKLLGLVQGRHYWPTVADVLRRVQTLVGWGRLTPADDAPAPTNFGDAAYLPELSVYPSETNDAGRPPTPERVQFLATMLRTMRPTARALVLNGYGTPRPAVARAHEQLLRAFLNDDTLWRDTPHQTLRVAGQGGQRNFRIESWRVGDHLVLITRGLHGQVSEEYLQAVAELIASVF